MNAYILRAKPHGKNQENEFLDGHLSVGWPCGVSFEGKDREELSSILTDRYHDITETSVSMVALFVKIPITSIVLTPSLQNRSLIHIFRTTSMYKYDHLADFDNKGNPHFVDAEFLKTVARDSLPKAVLHSLSGARKTLSRISQHYGVLDDFVSSGYDANFDTLPLAEDNRSEAVSVLYELLSNEDDNIRLQAAVAIVNFT
jgi:hypothetical protein